MSTGKLLALCLMGLADSSLARVFYRSAYPEKNNGKGWLPASSGHLSSTRFLPQGGLKEAQTELSVRALAACRDSSIGITEEEKEVFSCAGFADRIVAQLVKAGHVLGV